jgi:light-regulated signal transduction histidine kinase (bacteriophytochrome)
MQPNLLSITPNATAMMPEEDNPAALSEAQRLRADLELFSYIASHDLRAPLRIMSVGCDELSEHPAIAADEKAGAALRMIVSQSSHMQSLLDGLLEYMRLETFPVKHTLLDMDAVVATAITTLEAEINASGATITCAKLPQVCGHRGRMTRLFAHLLDNAIKFRGPEPVKIHISARRLGKGWEFCVEDNGIGIDEEYHGIIFTLFQRLHTKEAYPGIGAGLALSRKIVESHGGAIRVESALQKGSRVYFTLPELTQEALCS